MTIEQIIQQAVAEALRSELPKQIEPLTQHIQQIEGQIASSAKNDRWVKFNELPEHLGSVSLSKLKQYKVNENAPKPDILGLYSVTQWSAFLGRIKDAA